MLYRRIKPILLAMVAAILLPAIFTSCSVARENGDYNKETAKGDTIKEFTPTHPPVVIPHSWREHTSK